MCVNKISSKSKIKLNEEYHHTPGIKGGYSNGNGTTIGGPTDLNEPDLPDGNNRIVRLDSESIGTFADGGDGITATGTDLIGDNTNAIEAEPDLPLPEQPKIDVAVVTAGGPTPGGDVELISNEPNLPPQPQINETNPDGAGGEA